MDNQRLSRACGHEEIYGTSDGLYANSLARESLGRSSETIDELETTGSHLQRWRPDLKLILHPLSLEPKKDQAYNLL